MLAIDPKDEQEAFALELLRRYDGAERVPLLGMARLTAVAPGNREGEPTVVAIEWPSRQIEHPPPGSSLWRAVLERRLAEPGREDLAESMLRRQIETSLARYPDLETWWRWLRTGWTTAPVLDAPKRKHRPWWRRWRRT